MSLISSIIKAFVGDKSQKDVKATQPYITKIKALESNYLALSNDELRTKTDDFKDRIKQARVKQDEEISAKKQEAENTVDIDLREEIYNAIDALEVALAGTDVEEIDNKVKELYEAIGPVTKVKSEEEQKAKETSESQKSDDNVVDAEVKEST